MENYTISKFKTLGELEQLMDKYAINIEKYERISNTAFFESEEDSEKFNRKIMGEVEMLGKLLDVREEFYRMENLK